LRTHSECERDQRGERRDTKPSDGQSVEPAERDTARVTGGK
jgi:hypothetical protein